MYVCVCIRPARSDPCITHHPRVPMQMTADMNGCTATLSMPTGIPALDNDPTVAAASASVLRSVLGPENVISTMPAVMGSDDMYVGCKRSCAEPGRRCAWWSDVRFVLASCGIVDFMLARVFGGLASA